MTQSQVGPDPAEVEARTDWKILNFLADDSNQRPWSTDEIEREIVSTIEAADGLWRLHACGLIHRTQDGFIFATRAAIRYREIAESN